MKRVLIFIMILLGSCHTATVTNQVNILKGLYHGEAGFLFHYIAFANVQDDIVVEIYLPFKGEILKSLTDTLSRENGNNYIFKGNKTVIYRKDAETYIKSIFPKSIDFREIPIIINSNNEAKLNVYRNRAFLFEERSRVLADSVGKSENKNLDFLWHKYNLRKLADSLTHEDFLKEYYAVRLKLDSLKNLQETN